MVVHKILFVDQKFSAHTSNLAIISASATGVFSCIVSDMIYISYLLLFGGEES
eukprot:c10575_g1_i1 orf=3-161(+)